ncbi:MAG: hypothetical protein Q9174_002283 [Haloplaca sp. 1 TL-2023]
MQPTAESPTSYHSSSSSFDAPSPNPNSNAQPESDGQSHQNKATEQKYQSWPTSLYNNVYVLLLKWAGDNLGVIDEVRMLETTFRNRYNFATEIWSIPSEDPEDELVSKLVQFRKTIRAGSLVILYYAGHGGGDPRECIWSATGLEGSPWLNWHNVQGLLLGHPPDVLLILDCCYAGLAMTNKGVGNNWFLGASVKESEAIGVSWKSFTSSMTRQLEGAADQYWSKKKSYHVQNLKSDLNFWEHHLPVSPDLTQLSSDFYRPIDLTPLKYPRPKPALATANTEPIMSGGITKVSIPRRPRQDHATLPSKPPGSGIISNATHTGPTRMDVANQDTQTLRFRGLPLDAEAKAVAKMLIDTLKMKVKVDIGPVVRESFQESSSKATIVTFPNIALAKRALQIQSWNLPSGASHSAGRCKIEGQFDGFTTIYSPQDTEPAVDIVMVHGADGHPYNSFASHYIVSIQGTSSEERCWPRNELPGLLEKDGVRTRVLVYGWPAEYSPGRGGSLDRSIDEFVFQLRDVRRSATKRPLVLLGHGLGVILIKGAVNSMINAGFGDENFENPVKACLFLAGSHTDVRALGPREASIRDIYGQFEAICKERNISILSFQHVSNPVQIPVRDEIATHLNTESSGATVQISVGYQDAASLPATLRDRQAILSRISQHISARIAPRRNPHPVKNKETIYARLRAYDTVFLVDDSDSMGGFKWQVASKVLAEIAAIAVKYDRNGVDVKFFNEPLEDNEGSNLDTAEKVMDLFRRIDPMGTTLTADRLDEVMNDYMYELRKDRTRKGLNLIVLTDGEPEEGQHVDQVIVKYANQLRDAGASTLKVGIQFVQIGTDDTATEFLRFLDDKLKSEHGLDRDMVDTVRWVDDDEEYLSEKILLGGILKKLDNNDKVETGTI